MAGMIISKRRSLLWLVPLALLLGWPVYGSGLSGFLAPPKPAGQDTAIDSRQSFTMQGVRLFQYQGEAVAWLINSSQLATGADDDELFIEKPDAVLFTDGSPRLFVRAESGRFDQAGELLTLMGGVSLKDGESFTLLSPTLVYDERNSVLSSDTGVEISMNGLIAKGQRFSYHLPSADWSIDGEVLFTSH